MGMGKFDLSDGTTSTVEVLVGVGAGIVGLAILWKLSEPMREAQIRKMDATSHAIREGKLKSYSEANIQGGGGGYGYRQPYNAPTGSTISFRLNPKKRKKRKKRKNPAVAPRLF